MSLGAMRAPRVVLCERLNYVAYNYRLSVPEPQTQIPPLSRHVKVGLPALALAVVAIYGFARWLPASRYVR